MKALIKASSRTLRVRLAVSAVLASCTPAHAISNAELCIGAAEQAFYVSKKQYYNLKLIELGKESKVSKEVEIAKFKDFSQKYRPIYVEAVEYGFDNPSLDSQFIREMAYSKCLHWMHLND